MLNIDICSKKFLSKSPVDNKSALVHIMTCVNRRQAIIWTNDDLMRRRHLGHSRRVRVNNTPLRLYIAVASYELQGVSNHPPTTRILLNIWFMCTARKTSKLCITGAFWWKSIGEWYGKRSNVMKSSWVDFVSPVVHSIRMWGGR